MAGKNRWLRGATNEWKIPVHGKTTIDKGEFVFVAQDGSCIVGGSADWYGYPAADLKHATSTYFEQNFLGVAMKGSVSGTSETIPVATSGIFKFQIKLGTSATSQYAKVGLSVAAATIGASGVSVSGTTVTLGTDGDHDACRIGRCVKHENEATNVEVMIMSRLAGTSMSVGHT